MKFALKRISYSAALSQETSAFTADVWIDGKAAGSCRNDGSGGATMVYLNLLSQQEYAKVQQWLERQPPKVYPAMNGMPEFSVPMDFDVIVDDLLETHLLARSQKRK